MVAGLLATVYEGGCAGKDGARGKLLNGSCLGLEQGGKERGRCQEERKGAGWSTQCGEEAEAKQPAAIVL